MLSFLLDAHVSPTVATQIQKRNPDIVICTLQQWQQGQYLQASDEIILDRASQHSLTLVTYDLKTIPNLLIEFGRQKRNHAGVIFVDEKTIKPNNIGGLVKSLSILWKEENKADWSNRLLHLNRRLDDLR